MPPALFGAIVLLVGIPAFARPQSAPTCAGAPSVAEPFASSLADSGRVYGGAFTPDGATLYYFWKTSSDVRSEDYRIMRARRENSWRSPQFVDLGGRYSDMYPVITADGRQIVFSSYRPAPGDTATKPNASLWMSRLEGDSFSSPEFLRLANLLGSYHSQTAITADGRLQFRRTTADWKSTEDLVARWNGVSFDRPTIVPEVARFRGWNSSMYVWGGRPGPADGIALLEVSKLDSATRRRGPSELWVTLRSGNAWSEPRPLEAGVNDPHAFNNFAFFSPDGCELFFVRGFSRFYHVATQAAIGAHR
ncbi:MAG TPA: hypothetical protein VHE78_04215 [Gemmatimonadaceae bacterium]|nr:hypothetical protein [Gemmatimonadaceae bacterium]